MDKATINIPFMMPDWTGHRWTAWFNLVLLFLAFLDIFGMPIVRTPIALRSAGDPTCGPCRWFFI